MPRRTPTLPQKVDHNCPFCGRVIDRDAKKVDISKMLKLQRGNIAYAHRTCVEERIDNGRSEEPE